MAGVVPLSSEMVAASGRIYATLPWWQTADEALTIMVRRLPERTLPITLLKVVAVNALYGTNLYATARMAEHIQGTLETVDVDDVGPELVDALAALPPRDNSERSRRHTSFASKYAHFVIDCQRFPIYDSFAVQMMERHLGPQTRITDSKHPYSAFALNIGLLKSKWQLACDLVELDRYLWLSGQLWSWRRGRSAALNTELVGVFQRPTPAQAADLELIGLTAACENRRG